MQKYRIKTKVLVEPWLSSDTINSAAQLVTSAKVLEKQH
jgi:hypothetical protein